MIRIIRNHIIILLVVAIAFIFSISMVHADTNNGELKENSWRYKNGELVTKNNKQATGSQALLMSSNRTVIRNGIDVSYAQGIINWDMVKASGIDYAILRVGYGNVYRPDLGKYEFAVDEQFYRNMSECERLNIPYGVYVYSYSNTVAETEWEARCVLQLIKGHNLEYPVYIDMEDKYTVGTHDNATINTMAKRFCEIVEDAGYMAGIYANLDWFNHKLTSDELDKYEKWVAQYYSICEYAKKYYMWQYSNEGSVSGISGNVDVNYDYVKRDFTRYAGSTRYTTAYSVANALKEKKSIDKFDNIVIAVGTRYPDALSGSYFARMKNAPILLYGDDQFSNLNNYINNNLKQGGTVYLLGDEESIPEQFKNTISKEYSVERIAGVNRYATNMELLNKYDSIEELLVCTGNNYPDSVSVSALDMPILLVDKELTEEQLVLLGELQHKGLSKIYIIGSDASVSKEVYNTLSDYAPLGIERIGGANRYETSRLVAEKFFDGKNPSTTIVTRGDNFPDGLVGGALAQSTSSPILLANTWAYSDARYYYSSNGISNIIALGDNRSVSNAELARIAN